MNTPLTRAQSDLLAVIAKRGKYYNNTNHELDILYEMGLIWQDSEVDDEFGYQKFFRVTEQGAAIAMEDNQS